MTTSITVRTVELDDLHAWKALWDGYNAFYKRVGPTAISDEMTMTTWSRFFDHYEPMHCHVASSGSQLVGLVHYIYHRNTTQFGPTCYLQDLFTAKEARGSGIGSALIGSVYTAARAAGSTRVYWHTEDTNATARRVYDQVARDSGFIVYRHDL